jgi:hypothetical protein
VRILYSHHNILSIGSEIYLVIVQADVSCSLFLTCAKSLRDATVESALILLINKLRCNCSTKETSHPILNIPETEILKDFFYPAALNPSDPSRSRDDDSTGKDMQDHNPE